MREHYGAAGRGHGVEAGCWTVTTVEKAEKRQLEDGVGAGEQNNNNPQGKKGKSRGKEELSRERGMQEVDEQDIIRA